MAYTYYSYHTSFHSHNHYTMNEKLYAYPRYKPFSSQRKECQKSEYSALSPQTGKRGHHLAATSFFVCKAQTD